MNITSIQFQKFFAVLKENLVPIKQSFTIYLSSNLWQPLIYLLSLHIYLSWIFHVNKTIRYVAFCAWLLSVIITPHFYTPISSARRTRTLKIPIPPSRLIPTFFSGCILYFTLGLYCPPPPPLPDRAEQYLLHSVDTVLPTVRFFFNIYLTGCTGYQGQDLFFCFFLVAASELLVVTCGIQFPDQGLNPGPVHQEREALTTGPPGKFPYVPFKEMVAV